MNLGKVYILFQMIAESLGYVKDVTLEQFNVLLEYADRELRKQVYGHENSPKGFETSQKRTDEIRHAKGKQTITFTAGISTLPTDYFRMSSVMVGDVKVNIVTDYELENILDNAVIPPAISYPYGIIEGDTLTIYPNSITSATLRYLKHPTAPHLRLKDEHGVYVYDSATSVELQWPDEKKIDIIRIMLSIIGLSVGRSDIVQYVEQKQMSDND